MGMRINTGSGIDPGLVDQLIEIEKIPAQRVAARRDTLADEQKLFGDLRKLVSDFGSSLNSLRTRSDFQKLKIESSRPDIVEGTVDFQALPGTYQVEVFSLANTHKLLTNAYPDKDKTPVGFGYMTVETEDGRFDVDIDPSESTLQDVAKNINAADKGVRAVVINTKENLEKPGDDAYRLLVISEKSGKAAKVFVDPDTTFLEFNDQVKGSNLKVLFEDVPVFDTDNTLDSLMPGLILNAKKAEPGTKVSVTVSYDIDAALDLITGLVDGYNGVNEFVEKQFQIDPRTNQSGPLSKDNSLKTLKRTLQTALQYAGGANSKYRSLAELGIVTDPKSGALTMDEAKVRQALSEDYDAVASLFVQTDKGRGLGSALSEAVRGTQNFQSGILASKDRQYKRMLESMDKDIERKERSSAQRAEGIKRRFAALESVVSGMNAQGQALQARLAGM